MNRFFFMCLLIVSTIVMAGCGSNRSPFMDYVTTEQIMQGPDGRITRVVNTQSIDRSGSIAGNVVGAVFNVLTNGANAAIATNFGNNYSESGQILHGLTYSGTNLGSNWGTDAVYCGGGSNRIGYW